MRQSSIHWASRPKPQAASILHDIDMTRCTQEFHECWAAAARHLHFQGQGSLNWIRDHCKPPYGEHLSFRMGNQIFFVRIEDADHHIDVPGNHDGFLSLAERCNAQPFLMPMRKRGMEWRPVTGGWGLLRPDSRNPVNPVESVTDELIEMSDWEVHDTAVQVIRNNLEKDGRELMSWCSDTDISPSIWFVGEDGPEYVVVKAARYPAADPALPENIDVIREQCRETSTRGNFAAFVIANAGFGNLTNPGR